MKRILNLLVLLMAMTTGVTAAEDITLSVTDMQFDWGGYGGEANATENSITFPNWANNYWTAGDLSTNEYTRLDMTFAQPVNYYRMVVKAVYSDESETESVINYGSTNHSLTFERNKTLVKVMMMQLDWEGLNKVNGEDVAAKIYFRSITILTKESAEASTPSTPKTTVTSPKLGTGMANPLLDFQFCADPTAVEHDGRLYVYGTNDHQQYDEGAPTNSYERIKTLVMMSTDDMVNWTYHGLIPVGTVAPWIIASWAPSIISRPQADGSTLFSLYFSNSGWGIGVIQAKSPVGPWTSPLNTSLIDGNNETVKGSGAIFDPGAVIDDNGDAWLSFGNSQGWIAKLNPDLHSFAEGPVRLLSPYHNEANELNYINGTYVYTYNNDWGEHTPWTWGGEKPTQCSMNYFTSKTPLITDSWTYGGNYFRNPCDNGMGYLNNHSHLHKYQGHWYLFYQTKLLEPLLGSNGGFRSIYVDEMEVDEANVILHECKPTKKGVTAIKNLDPYALQRAATSAATLGILYQPTDEPGRMVATVGTTCITADTPTEGIIEVRNASFTAGLGSLKMLVKGNGSVTLRLDDKDGADVLTISSTGDSWQTLTASCSGVVAGTHTVYFILTGSVQFDTWQAVAADTGADSFEKAPQAVDNMKIGWNLGNTLDAFNDDTMNKLTSETCWSQPKTKAELFPMFKDAGFGAIRVPVTWFNHMDTDGKVDKAWMKRVHEVVDYVINAGLYCILNVHHDTGADSEGHTSWLKADMDIYNNVKEKYEYLWQQIATEFRDYDEHLLFEGYNEMLDADNSWSYASSKNTGSYDATAASAAYSAINSYAQSFVNAVRATGGNNAMRNLIVNTYGSCSGEGTWNAHLQDPLQQMQLPTDNVADHLIFEVHAYPGLAGGLSNAKSSINQIMSAVETHLASKGAPVIFGEWGTANYDTDYDNRHNDMLAFAQYFVEQAKAKGFATFYWMGLSDGTHRSVPEFNQADLKDAIYKGYYGVTPSSISTLPVENTSSAVEHYYDLQGRQFQHPLHGLNLVRMSDVSVRKVIKD